MATKILFSPKFPKPIYDIAVEMTPPGFELVPVDSMTPQFLEAAKDAEYFMGFGRSPLSHDFFAAGRTEAGAADQRRLQHARSRGRQQAAKVPICQQRRRQLDRGGRARDDADAGGAQAS